MRVAEGLPSVSALFLEKCGLLTDETEAREIVKQALSGEDVQSVRARCRVDRDATNDFADVRDRE
jgi:hypothetical protein